MKTISLVAQLLPALAVALAAPAWAQMGSPAGSAVGEVTRISATVDHVDQATRTVTLANADGSKVAFVAGPDVRNLAQLARGDKVTITYAQAIAARLSKTTNRVPERTVTEGLERTAPGQKPGGVATRETRIVASVERVDAAAGVVTLRGPENVVDLRVRDPAMLAGVVAGDFVEATYTEAVAINVTAGQ